jgi:hypothetical protein
VFGCESSIIPRRVARNIWHDIALASIKYVETSASGMLPEKMSATEMISAAIVTLVPVRLLY